MPFRSSFLPAITIFLISQFFQRCCFFIWQQFLLVIQNEYFWLCFCWLLRRHVCRWLIITSVMIVLLVSYIWVRYCRQMCVRAAIIHSTNSLIARASFSRNWTKLALKICQRKTRAG